MNPRSPEGKRSGASAQAAPRDIVWMIVLWGRVLVGLILAMVGGVVFGHAWTREYAPFWWGGGISLLTGILLVLSAIYARSRPPGVTPEVLMREELAEGREPVVPLLGALLLYKFQRITQRQLNEALERQRNETGEDRRRLGEILLAMGAITPRQLGEALEHQRTVVHEKEAAHV